MSSLRLAAVSAAFLLSGPLHVGAQVMSWCKEDRCGDCVSSLTKASGSPECVIYDTETVFGGLGFDKIDTDSILYRAWGQFEAPCDGGSGNIMIRSPSALAQEGCGNLIYNTASEEACNGQINLESSFTVQFCCGADDCQAAGVPWKRGIAGHTDRPNALNGGAQSVLFTFPNGTAIEPIAVGNPPQASELRKTKKRCSGWKEDSYIPDGERYLTTFTTQTLSASMGPGIRGATITVTEIKGMSRTTTFPAEVGDPFGIISASVGFEFTDPEKTRGSYKVAVPPGVSGYVGFTPYYICYRGSLTACDSDEATDGQACAALVIDGVIQGDVNFVQQG